MIGGLHAALHALRQGLNPAVDEAQAGRLRAARLTAIVRLTPISVLANIIDGGIVVGVFWKDGPRLFLTGWALAILVICWGNMRAWLRSRTRPMPRKSSTMQIGASPSTSESGAGWSGPTKIFRTHRIRNPAARRSWQKSSECSKQSNRIPQR
jgi:hypothetical protein